MTTYMPKKSLSIVVAQASVDSGVNVELPVMTSSQYAILNWLIDQEIEQIMMEKGLIKPHPTYRYVPVGSLSLAYEDRLNRPSYKGLIND